MTENKPDFFTFEDPVLILRVCKLDEFDKLRPTLGDPAFEWPREGKIEDAGFVDNGACGAGLHGHLVDQILKVGFLNPNDARLAYLVVEAEATEVRNLGNKVKFPRGNVIFAGSWRDCLQVFRECGYTDVPTENQVLQAFGWERLTLPKEEEDPVDGYEFPELGEYDRWRDGVKEGHITFEEVWDLRNKMLDPKFDMTEEEAQDYAKKMHECNAALRYFMFVMLQKNIPVLFKVHPHIEKLMVSMASGSSAYFKSEGKQPDFDANDLFKWFANGQFLPNSLRYGPGQINNLRLNQIDPDDRLNFGKMSGAAFISRNKAKKAYWSYIQLRTIFRLYGQDPPHRPLIEFEAEIEE